MFLCQNSFSANFHRSYPWVATFFFFLISFCNHDNLFYSITHIFVICTLYNKRIIVHLFKKICSMKCNLWLWAFHKATLKVTLGVSVVSTFDWERIFFLFGMIQFLTDYSTTSSFLCWLLGKGHFHLLTV